MANTGRYVDYLEQEGTDTAIDLLAQIQSLSPGEQSYIWFELGNSLAESQEDFTQAVQDYVETSWPSKEEDSVPLADTLVDALFPLVDHVRQSLDAVHPTSSTEGSFDVDDDYN